MCALNTIYYRTELIMRKQNKKRVQMLKWEKGGESIDWWNFSQYFINTDTRIQRQAVSLSLSLEQQPHILNWNVNGTMAPIIPTLYKQVSSVFARVVCKILLFFQQKQHSIPQYGHQVNSVFRVYWNRPISSYIFSTSYCYYCFRL